MNSLFQGILGGIAGGANAYGNQLRLEAEEARKRSFLELQQQYARENTMLQDELAGKRDEKNYNRGLLEKADNREYEQKEKQIAELKAEAQQSAASKDSWEKLKYQADRADATAARPSESDKKQARIDKMLEEGKITPEEHKNYVLGLQKTSTGALTEDQRLDALSALRVEYDSDPEAQKKDGGWFGEDKPAIPFSQWLKEKRPEAYSILVGKKGAMEQQAGSSKGNPLLQSMIQQAKGDQSNKEPANIAAQRKNVAGILGEIYADKEQAKEPPAAKPQVLSNIPTTREEAQSSNSAALMDEARKMARLEGITITDALKKLYDMIDQANEASRSNYAKRQ